MLDEDWNAIKGSAKPKTEELKALNCYLEEVRGKLVQHYGQIERNDLELTAFTVKDAYLGIAQDDSAKHSVI